MKFIDLSKLCAEFCQMHTITEILAKPLPAFPILCNAFGEQLQIMHIFLTNTVSWPRRERHKSERMSFSNIFWQKSIGIEYIRILPVIGIAMQWDNAHLNGSANLEHSPGFWKRVCLQQYFFVSNFTEILMYVYCNFEYYFCRILYLRQNLKVYR